MSLYEITFLTKEESDTGVRKTIEELGGTIEGESSLGRKRLIYPIQKETQAVYTTFIFDAPSIALTALNRKLGLNNEVLRYLVVRKEAAKSTKEVSKAIREAIAAAEKLQDTTEEMKREEVVENQEKVTETPEVSIEETPEEKPVKKTRDKKAEKKEDAAAVTEEDRLKALEDKLGEILKD